MPVPVAPRAPRALGLGLRSGGGGPALPALPGARGAAPGRRRRGPPPAPYFGGYGYGYGGGGGGLGTVVALGVLIAVGQRLLRGGGGGPLLGELGGDAVGVAKVQVRGNEVVLRATPRADAAPSPPSQEFWESKGWIDPQDPRGRFQW